MVMKQMTGAVWWCAGVVVVAGLAAREAAYVTSLINTLFELSPVYKLPTWESPLTIFGVKSEGDVDLVLLHSPSGANVTISIQMSKFSGETQLTSYLPSPASSKTVVSRDMVRLNPHTFTWFTVFRRGSFIALFAEKEARLILAYTLEKDMKLNFLDYTDFRVRSYYDAVWDFLGDQYPGLGKGPCYVEVVKEVQAAAKGLIHRLLMLEQVLDVKPLDKMPQTTKKIFLTHLQRTEAFMFMCRFYGFNFVKHVKFFPWKRLKAGFKEVHGK
ncbi:hypothetical protein E2C01_102726 [Portunus trituberculatus]|uniref:Uncharacterized protein n=1 Tax=Portunus trituberculatus TaxID=210409 RepID=A0A5B7KJ18_PORTR|nr:hypothetical protein [Portunus trituberculatus]